jgi:hypothetical protein
LYPGDTHYWKRARRFPKQAIPNLCHINRLQIAFHYIEREFMFAILRSYRKPDATVKAITVFYDNSKSAVKADGRISDTFQISTGLLQANLCA